MSKALAVQTTFADRNEAVEFARKIIDSRLAACVQLSAEVDSFFWWKDGIEHDKEIVVTMKTLEQVYPKLEMLIEELHSYETPEILATPILYGSKGYLEWLKEEILGR